MNEPNMCGFGPSEKTENYQEDGANMQRLHKTSYLTEFLP